MKKPGFSRMNLSKTPPVIIIITVLILVLAIYQSSYMLARKAGTPQPLVTISAGSHIHQVPPTAFCSPRLDLCFPHNQITYFPFTDNTPTIISLPPSIYKYVWSYFIQYAHTYTNHPASSQVFFPGNTPRTLILHTLKNHPIIFFEIDVYAIAVINHTETAVTRAVWSIQSSSPMT